MPSTNTQNSEEVRRLVAETIVLDRKLLKMSGRRRHRHERLTQVMWLTNIGVLAHLFEASSRDVITSLSCPFDSLMHPNIVDSVIGHLQAVGGKSVAV